MRRYVNSITRLKQPRRFWKDYYRYKNQQVDHMHDVAFRNGFRLKFPHQLISAFDEIFLRGVYDESLTGLKKGSVVVDLGGNAGFFSLAAAMRAQDIQVVAVEPLAVNARLYHEQMKLNGLTKYELIEKAVLTNEEGYLALHIESEDHVSVSASMMSKKKTKTQIKVPALSFDELLDEQQLDKIDLLKIDCEGAEYNIVFNASDEALARVSKIVIETHHWVPEEEGTVPQLRSYLEQKGFRTRVLHKDILLGEKA